MPPYIFSEINRLKAEAEKKGQKLLSLAIGDPDLSTPGGILDAILQAAKDPANHGYSPYEGSLCFRKAASAWMDERFGVKVEPESEVVALIGSKEGIAHFPLSILNPGDTALHPSPGYPVFQTSILLTGAKPIPIPHAAKDLFLPDPKKLEELIKQHSPKLMLLNYPSNPTSVTPSLELLTEIVRIAKKYSVPIGYDNAYAEVYYDHKPHSILEVPGAKEIAIEFHSFSKTFNMTGWRIGFATGNKDLLAGLLKVKTHIDSGPLLSVQNAVAKILPRSQEFSEAMRSVYRQRKELFTKGLRELDLEFIDPHATFFVWAKIPNGMPSLDFAKDLIEKVGVVVTPGIGFGEEGEGFFRMALTISDSDLEGALSKLKQYLLK